MFCPNCGTQNPDTAQTCSKCNFNVKGAAAPKFKGTMLMMNQPQVPVPGAGPAPAGPSPAPPAAPAPQQAAPPSVQRPSGTGAAPIGASKLKGTMVGVAPMAGGFGAPGTPFQAPAANPAPIAAPPATSRSAPPPPAASPPRTPPPPAPGPPEVSAYSPPVPQAGVNPLGGTMAADVNPYQQQFQQPPQYGGPPPQQYGAPPGGQPQNQQHGQYGAPPGQPPQGYGQPPNAYGAPPGPGAYGAPPVQPGYVQAPQGAYHQAPPQQGWGPPPEGYGQQPPQGYTPQPGYGAPGQGYGAPPGQGQPMQGGMVPYGGGAPASNFLASLQSASGPTRRNPVSTLVPFFVLFGASFVLGILARLVPLIGLLQPLISLGCVAWFFVVVIPMVNELKAVTRNPDFAWWPLFIPFYSMYWAWILVPQEVANAKQLLGVQQPVRPIVLYIFLFPFAMASDINDMVRG